MRRENWALWSAYVLSRIPLIFFFSPISSDIPYYVQRAAEIHFGGAPYRDIPFEYPPLTLIPIYFPFALASWFFGSSPSSDELVHFYVQAFRLEMFVAELLAFFLFISLIRRWRPEKILPAGFAYVLCTAMLGHVIYDRLDSVFLLLLVAWAYAWHRSLSEKTGESRWLVLSYAVLGLSISYKLASVVFLPFLFLSELREKREFSRILLCLGALIAGIGIPFALVFPVAGTDAFNFLDYHWARGIQVESVYAAVAMIAGFFGMPISIETSFGSANVVSPISPIMRTISSWIFFGILAATFWLCYRRKDRFDRSLSWLWAVLALCLTTIFAKVLSAQYFVWILPLLLLAGAGNLSDTSFKWLCTALCFLAGMSVWIFPYHYFDLGQGGGLAPNLEGRVQAVLIVRNVLTVGLVFWIAWKRARVTQNGAGDRI